MRFHSQMGKEGCALNRPKRTSQAKDSILGRDEFLSLLHQRIRDKYQDKHPFMAALYAGKLTRKQMKAWIINRFYLQRNIPLKDAAILSNCPEPEVRKLWIGRILKREGLGGSIGDVEGWIGFAEAAGITRDEVLRANCLPGVKFAVDGYVNFARRATWIEGVAVSLFEYFAKTELVRRIEAFKRHYQWIEPEGYRFSLSRLAQLDEANETTLRIVLRYSPTRQAQLDAISAAAVLSDVYWSIHDALYVAYVVQDRPLAESL